MFYMNNPELRLGGRRVLSKGDSLNFDYSPMEKHDNLLDALYTVESILEVLEPVHKAGIIHGDLSPDNLLRTKRKARTESEHTITIHTVIDSGSAFKLEDIRTMDILPKFTRSGDFTAPEICVGMPMPEEIGFWSDLYSIGMIFCWLLDITQDALSTVRLDKDNPVASGMSSRVIALANEVITTSIKANPFKRYQTVDEMKKAVAKAIGKVLDDRTPLDDFDNEYILNGHKDKYKIEYKFSSGGNALIYLAEAVSTSTPVIVKEFYPKNKGIERISSSDSALDVVGNTSFEIWKNAAKNESALINYLVSREGGYVNYVELFDDCFEINNTYYMVGRFRDYKKLEQHDNLLDALNSVERVLEALEPIHEAGLLHGDISDGNFLRTKQVAKKGKEHKITIHCIIDFGSAFFLQQYKDDKIQPNFVRSGDFTAPEIRNDLPGFTTPDPDLIGYSSDLFSVGMLFSWFINLNNSARIEENNPITRGVSPRAILLTNKFIEKSLMGNPFKRYQTVGEMLEAVAAVIDEAEKKEYLIAPKIKATHHFTGRKTELTDLAILLECESWCDVVGMGGIGKTEVVKRYAEEKQKAGVYHTVAFVTYKRDLESTIASLNFANVDKSVSHQKIAQRHYDLLMEAPQGVLLIIDNFDVNLVIDEDKDSNEEVDFKEKETLWRNNLKKLHNTKVIFTTRISLDGTRSRPSPNQLFIKELCEDAAFSLFAKHCPQSESFRPSIISLLTAIKLHTVVLILTAKLLDKYDYLDDAIINDTIKNIFVDDEMLSLAELDAGASDGSTKIEFEKDEQPLHIAYAIAHTRRLFDLANLSKCEMDVLSSICFTPFAGIDEDFFLQAMGDSVKDIVLGLVNGGWLNNDGLLTMHPVIRDAVCGRNILDNSFSGCEKYISHVFSDLSPQFHREFQTKIDSAYDELDSYDRPEIYKMEFEPKTTYETANLMNDIIRLIHPILHRIGRGAYQVDEMIISKMRDVFFGSRFPSKGRTGIQR